MQTIKNSTSWIGCRHSLVELIVVRNKIRRMQGEIGRACLNSPQYPRGLVFDKNINKIYFYGDFRFGMARKRLYLCRRASPKLDAAGTGDRLAVRYFSVGKGLISRSLTASYGLLRYL